MIAGNAAGFRAQVAARAEHLARRPDYPALLTAKARQLAAAQKQRPLDAYRAAELAIMDRNFSDPSEPYARLRRAFVYKENHRTHRCTWPGTGPRLSPPVPRTTPAPWLRPVNEFVLLTAALATLHRHPPGLRGRVAVRHTAPGLSFRSPRTSRQWEPHRARSKRIVRHQIIS